MNRGITKKEMLLAIAMSEYYGKSLVHFIPPKTSYITMLKAMRSLKFVEYTNEFQKHYKLTEKGRKYLLRQDVSRFRDADIMVDKFVDNL